MEIIRSRTEVPEMVFDADGSEGQDGIQEAKGKFKLDAHTWLPFAAKTYELPMDLSDYVITLTPMLPSDVPNRNGIAFPLAELTKFRPPPIARMAYKAWAGCPLHLEHDNEDYRTAIGVVLDTSLRRITGFNGNQIWKIMSLVAVSKTKNPEIAGRVLREEINTYSMGAEGEHFSCSYCGRIMQRYNHCSHLNPEQPIDWDYVTDHEGKKHLVFRNAHGLSPFEFSVVEDPAWIPATGSVLTDSLVPKSIVHVDTKDISRVWSNRP